MLRRIAMIRLIPAALLATLCACTLSKRDMKIAELSISGAAQDICIKAGHGKEQFKPEVLSISTITPYGLESVWSEVIQSSAQLPVSPTTCIPINRSNPVPKLEKGIAYHAFIRNGSTTSRLFMGYFCVIDGPDAPQVRQLRRDRRSKAWDWSVCELREPIPACASEIVGGGPCHAF